MELSISVSGKSRNMLTNYGRQLAHLALYYNCLPTKLDKELVLDYLHFVKTTGTLSATFFQVYNIWNALCLQNAWLKLFAVQFTCDTTSGQTSRCSKPAGGKVTA